jgi:hypothetical protein
VRLKNTGDDHLKNLNIKMHSLDSVHTIVESIIGELVNDGITVRQQKESTSDDPVDRCEIIQKLYKICKDLRDSGLHFRTSQIIPSTTITYSKLSFHYNFC